VRAGLLRHKVTIQSNTPTVDSKGGVIESWSTYATRRCSIKVVSATETNDQNKEFASIVYKFTFRQDSKTENILPAMRISYDSRTFDIETAPAVAGYRMVVVTARELV